MKRPFAVIGFTGFAVLLVLFLCKNSFVACSVLFISAALGVISLFHKNTRQAMTVPVGLFTVAAACLLFVFSCTDTLAAQDSAGDNVRVEAVVSEPAYMKSGNDRHYCVLELNSVDGKRVKGKLRLSFSPSKNSIDPDELEVGSAISFTGKVYIPGQDDEGISRYFWGESIVLGAYSPRDVSIEAAASKGILRMFVRIRQLVSSRLRYGFPDRIAGILSGMLTGDKSFLDAEIYDAFCKTGIAHLMAVSGFHLSLWVFSLGSLIPEDDKKSRLKYIFLAFAVIFIMLIAGMSESVKRAGFMALVYIAGKLSKHRSDSINSLGLAVTVMLLFNPSSVLSLSLQLSFLSTLGILTLGAHFMKLSKELFGGKINTPFKRLVASAADIFFISISVLVFTFPVAVYAFNGISTVSAWVNILVTPVAAPVLFLSGIYVLFSSVGFVAFPVAACVKALANYVIFVAQAFSKIRNAFIVFEADNLLLYLAGSVIVAYLCLIAFKKSLRTLPAAVLSVFLSALMIFTNNALSADKATLHFYSYGDCSAAAVEKDNEAVLLNTVPEYERGLFTSYLDDKGISLSSFLESKEGLILKSSRDGKEISSGKRLELFEGVTLSKKAEGQRVKLYGKYIHIFYADALHCECNCDIIINILDNDIVISAEDKSFYLAKQQSLTLTLSENKMILRGKNPWLNLMKNS